MSVPLAKYLTNIYALHQLPRRHCFAALRCALHGTGYSLNPLTAQLKNADMSLVNSIDPNII